MLRVAIHLGIDSKMSCENPDIALLPQMRIHVKNVGLQRCNTFMINYVSRILQLIYFN